MGSLTELAREYRAERRIGLLDGRLTVDLPDEAIRQPFRDQPKPESVFTRVVVPGPPGQRISIFVDELFVTCADELAGVVRSVHAGEAARGWYPVFSGQGLVETAGLGTAVLSTTPGGGLDRWDADVYVRHPDTSIQRLRMSASRSAIYHAGADLHRLAVEIVKTLRPGPRVLDGRGGRHDLAGERCPGLTVDTPPRWYAYRERHRSLDRHVLHRLGEFGRRPPAVVQILVDDGALPADHLSADGTDLGHRPPRLFGERVRWYLVDGVLTQSGRKVRAAGAPYPGGGPARVWVAADDDPSLDAIVASIAPAPAGPGQSQPRSVG